MSQAPPRNVWESLPARLPDGGPMYAETNLSRTIAEPFNAASALLFLVIVGYWFWKLRGRYQNYPFLSLCLPVLFAGGLGGVIYHATRSSRVWLLMDLMPILILCLLASFYLWVRLGARWWQVALGVLPLLGIQYLGFYLLPARFMVNVSYALLAMVILLPIGLLLYRTRGRHGLWVGLGVAAFVVALFFRAVDSWSLLPMGTHWLWHSFGAVASACTASFIYRVEGEPGNLREAVRDHA